MMDHGRKLMAVMNLDKLEVWVNARDFAVAIYRDVVPSLPVDEKWNLVQQLKRSAQSIPANIAEGHGRYHFLDNVRFCYIARGSLTEVQSHMALACELGCLPPEQYDQMTLRAESLAKKLNNYIAYLRRSKHGADVPPSSYTVRELPEPYLPYDPDEDASNNDL